MISIKRRVANLIEKMSGNLVIPPNEIAGYPEKLFLRRFFKHFEIDCVFDVGANKGQYARRLRDEVGFEGHIVSFEPIPELADPLRNASKSDSRWHIESVALDNVVGVKSFNVMKATDFSSLHNPSQSQLGVFKTHNVVDRIISVNTSTLDVMYEKWKIS